LMTRSVATKRPSRSTPRALRAWRHTSAAGSRTGAVGAIKRQRRAAAPPWPSSRPTPTRTTTSLTPCATAPRSPWAPLPPVAAHGRGRGLSTLRCGGHLRLLPRAKKRTTTRPCRLRAPLRLRLHLLQRGWVDEGLAGRTRGASPPAPFAGHRRWQPEVDLPPGPRPRQRGGRWRGRERGARRPGGNGPARRRQEELRRGSGPFSAP